MATLNQTETEVLLNISKILNYILEYGFTPFPRDQERTEQAVHEWGASNAYKETGLKKAKQELDTVIALKGNYPK